MRSRLGSLECFKIITGCIFVSILSRLITLIAEMNLKNTMHATVRTDKQRRTMSEKSHEQILQRTG